MARRAPLTLLLTSALLTTSIGSWDDSHPPAPIASDPTPETRTERERADEPGEVRGPFQEKRIGEPQQPDPIVSRIFTRLSARHTALPPHERMNLARTIVREALAHDLEPDLVLAVIEVESAGYHLAVSHVGAMGLMQLLPSTAEELAGKLGLDWHGNDTLFDPTINIKLGTAYLRELADRYGNVTIALAAYNWGPGRIDRRLRRGATVPSRYIEQVMRAYDRRPDAGPRRS